MGLIFYELLPPRSSPQLGRYAHDLESYVKELEMIDGEPLVDFYCRANIMLYEIELQEDTTGQANKLLYCFVSLLSSLADFHQSLESLCSLLSSSPVNQTTTVLVSSIL